MSRFSYETRTSTVTSKALLVDQLDYINAMRINLYTKISVAPATPISCLPRIQFSPLLISYKYFTLLIFPRISATKSEWFIVPFVSPIKLYSPRLVAHLVSPPPNYIPCPQLASLPILLTQTTVSVLSSSFAPSRLLLRNTSILMASKSVTLIYSMTSYLRTCK